MRSPAPAPDQIGRRLGRSALVFVAIGLVLYAGVYWASERLVYRTGDANPFFKIATAETLAVDWAILGASHAMPLDFADFNRFMETETGLEILNLSAPGAGPLYNRFVLEHFLERGRAANVLYVVDAFAFHSPAWNEDRFADAKLLRRTPFDPAIARRLIDYSLDEGVAATASLDYVTGFSKLNNRERFEPDIWEGEAKFERAFRPSASAEKQRVGYLYPDGTANEQVLSRYLGVFASLIDEARDHGANIVVVKLPVPGRYYRFLPDEPAFDATIIDLLATRGVSFYDFSDAIDDPRRYFDTDHLNRDGLTEFFTQHLKSILKPDRSDGTVPAHLGPAVR